MSSLRMARVAILEGRLSDELASLVRRHDGVPYFAPALREASLDRREQVAAFIASLAAGPFEAVLFLTGAGAGALFAEADRLGRSADLLDGLQRTTVVCRGPKAVGMLRRNGVSVAIRAREPYTTKELLEAVQGVDLKGKVVGLVHYGERNVPLAQALQGRGARLEELFLYEWLLPEDTGPLETLVRDLIAGKVDAIAFTSQVQARHLFRVASMMGLESELADALNSRTTVASVGPTCSAALEDQGVKPHVAAEHPKMGHLIVALARHLEGERMPAPQPA